MQKNYKLTILGCGSSPGVPTIDTGWGKCNPTNPKNIRTRTSALLTITNNDCKDYLPHNHVAPKANQHNIASKSFNILFDVGPDFRQQSLQNNIKQIDAILFTHHHADHIYGIDDLRSMNRLMGKIIPAYATLDTYQAITKTHYYLFNNPTTPVETDVFYKPALNFNIFNYYDILPLNNNIKVQTTLQDHGRITSAGFVMDKTIGYITDFVYLSAKTLALYKNLPLIVIAGVTLKPHPSHMGIYEVLDLLKILQPQKAVLTHMSEQLDYDFVQSLCPPNISPSYDGLILEVSGANIPE